MGNEPTQDHFSLLTINSFGGPLWSPARRLPALRRELDRLAVDVVCLQEVQSRRALRLFGATSATYPTATYQSAPRHPLGGLCTLSRQTVHHRKFIRYTNQGPWLGPTMMDRLTRKGVLITEIDHRTLPITVLNTHILANYGGNWQRQARSARQQWHQLAELAAIVRKQPADVLLLLAGDFNIPRGCWLYTDFLAQSGLTDPLAGDYRPTYRPFPGVSARYALPIDFVFLRTPPGMAVKTQTALHFAGRVPYAGGGVGYMSDHLGVQVTVEFDVPS
ncbi:MAG: endonuclease/exonuclease/phosphatase family protein [Caldilineaceae bacterium]